MPSFPYSDKILKEAKSLLTSKKVGFISFSEGTYQVEVTDLNKKKYWPFLQIDERGRLIDGFCSCETAEKTKSCAHLGAAYLKIFQGHSLPIHIRFRLSLWNQLAQIGCRRHGYDVKAFKKAGGGFEASSVTGKRLFSIKAGKVADKKILEELLFERKEQTEETSLKFSNLPPEELALWKEGRPSEQLLYELSLWADLAKWWMQLQDNGDAYEIDFSEEAPPKWIHVHFPSLSFSFYLAEANWPQIIPSLATVESPLPVHELQNQKISKILYNEEKKSLSLELLPFSKKAKDDQLDSAKKSVELGEWLFIPDKGFFPARMDPIFNQEEIPREKIAGVLHRHPQIIQKYLTGTKFHPGSFKAQYHLLFDAQDNLHISCYVFEVGDLQKKNSAHFGSWVFVEGKGFYLLENLLFEGVEKVIPRAQVGEFVNRHRVWLNGFENFQTHISSIESQLTYYVEKEGTLRFEAGLELYKEGGDFIDFGEWVYVKEKGFFAKSVGRAGIRSGTAIVRADITSFIRAHRDELETLPGFFTSHCPIEKSGLKIFLNSESKIVISPQFQLIAPYSPDQVLVCGDFTFVKGEGFCEIPAEKKLPEGYYKDKVVSAAEEPFFVAYELETLRPFALSIQKELEKAQQLFVRIRAIKRNSRKKSAEFLMDLNYETEHGSVDAYHVWKAISENKRYLFSPAGLIILKATRFSWLKNVSKKRWMNDGKFLRMTALDWLRLSVFDEIQGPEGKTKDVLETRRILQELYTFQTDVPIDLSGFKSDLRSYQETGVKWLWFLYCHSLSGLLCDEMGLGKTHQAMGLIAAVHNQKKEERSQFLVVCPTSVIYHWQELLKRFLPQIRVSIFYGIGRKLADFKDNADLLLTSYGTLRSEKKALSQIPFDVAVFDEIQIAKNAHSQTHKALKKIKAEVRLGLTGTPLENRLLELKALFDIVVPGYMPTEAQFKEMFVNPIEKNQDPEKKALLSRFIRHFILRRKKSEVLLELPEKIEEIAYCDLSAEQQELYRSTFMMSKEPLINDLKDNAKPVPYLHVFALLSTLKQICDHPCLITKQFSEFRKHSSGKWDLFVELLHEARDSGQKLVVFSQYLDMLNMIEAYLTEHKIGFAGIRGSTRNRKEQLDNFRDNPECEVFVASLQAAGVGVDLVSASVVIHYDRWWNPSRENQATDRVHRIGQNRGVQVFKMVTKNTIEEHIHRLIERKAALIQGVLAYDDQDQIKGLDRHELLELLSLINRDIEAGE